MTDMTLKRNVAYRRNTFGKGQTEVLEQSERYSKYALDTVKELAESVIRHEDALRRMPDLEVALSNVAATLAQLVDEFNTLTIKYQQETEQHAKLADGLLALNTLADKVDELEDRVYDLENP